MSGRGGERASWPYRDMNTLFTQPEMAIDLKEMEEA